MNLMQPRVGLCALVLLSAGPVSADDGPIVASGGWRARPARKITSKAISPTTATSSLVASKQSTYIVKLPPALLLPVAASAEQPAVDPPLPAPATIAMAGDPPIHSTSKKPTEQENRPREQVDEPPELLPPKSSAAVRSGPTDAEVQLRLARNAVKLGKIDDAVPAFEALLQLKPADVELRSEYAGVLVAAGRLREAERQYTLLLEKRPNNRELQMQMVNLYWQMKNWKKAAEILSGLLDRNAKDVEVAIALARTYTFAEDYDGAGEVYKKFLLNTPPKDAAGERQYGALLLELNRPADAVERLERARTMSSRLNEDLPILARAYALLGDNDKAQGIVDELRKLGAFPIPDLLQLGDFLRRSRTFGPSLSVFLHVVERQPANKAGRLGAARVYIEELKYREAAAILTQLAGQYSADRSFRQTMGYYHLLVGETELSKAAFCDLLKEDPTDAKSRIDLGDVFESTREFERAIGQYNQVPLKDPESWAARVGVAKSLSGLRRWDEANDYCRRMTAERPKSVEPYIQLARNLNKMHRPSQGVDLLRNYLAVNAEENRGTAAVRLTLAKLLIDSHRTPEALAEYTLLNASPAGRGPATDYGLAAASQGGAPSLQFPPGDVRYAITITDLNMEDYRFKEAIAAASTLLPTDPDNLVALQRIGDSQSAFKNRGFEFPAIETYQHMLAQSPHNSRARIGYARMAMSAKQYGAAIEAYDELLKGDPGYVVAHLEKARTYYSVPNFEAADQAYAEMTDVPLEEVLRHQLGDQLQKQKDERRRAQLLPLLAADSGKLRAEMDRVAPTLDDESRLAVQRLAAEYDAQVKIVSNVDLERRGKQWHGWANLTAMPPYEQLLKQEPINEEARFDLAQDHSNLHMTQAAATIYDELLDVKPFHRQAAIASDRLYLEHGPQVKLEGEAFGQRGRGVLANIDRYSLRPWLILPYRDEDEYVAVSEGVARYKPTDDSALYGNILSVRGQYKPHELLLLHAQANLESYENRFKERATFDVGPTWKINDFAQLRLTAFGNNVVENGETLRQDIHRTGVTAGMDFKRSRCEEFGGTYLWAHYSDANELSQVDLYYWYRICFLPQELKFIANADYWNFRHGTIYPDGDPNVLVGATHPYFTPDGYLQLSAHLEWKHIISKDTFKEANLVWYDVRGGVAIDDRGVPFFMGRAVYHQDCCLWLSFESEVSTQQSSVYRSVGANAYMLARLRHFDRTYCWKSCCTDY